MQNLDLGHVLPLTVTGTPIARGPAHTAERRACNAHAQQHATLDAAGQVNRLVNWTIPNLLPKRVIDRLIAKRIGLTRR
jgi:hypothetical protein